MHHALDQWSATDARSQIILIAAGSEIGLSWQQQLPAPSRVGLQFQRP